MPDNPHPILQFAGRQSLSQRVLLLIVWFAAPGLVSLALGQWLFGTAGWQSAGLAVGVCLCASLLALLVTSLVAPPNRPASHVLVGMLIRMSLPLLACLMVTEQNGELARAGFAWFLIVAFLWGLLLETLFSVSLLNSTVAESVAGRATDPRQIVSSVDPNAPTC